MHLILTLLYQFHKNHRCMMYYVCFLPLSLCMMNHSGDNHICGLKTKQRTSKMTLSIWQEKIETKWLENYSPKMCLTPLKISGLVFSILIPWRDICCHGPSQQLTENAKHHPSSLWEINSSFGWTKGVLRIYFSHLGAGWSIVAIVKMLGSH